jgi:hypothetical protein
MHLGLQDRTGTLEGGKRADLILISTTGWNMAPLNDPANQIVQAAHPGNVHSVLVDGRIVKWDGRITVIDEGTQHKLRERGGLPSQGTFASNGPLGNHCPDHSAAGPPPAWRAIDRDRRHRRSEGPYPNGRWFLPNDPMTWP